MKVNLIPIVSVLLLAVAGGCATKQPAVASPPGAFFESFRERDRDAARAFYSKYVQVGGLSIASAGVVDDAALLRTHDLVRHMLAGRPDVLAAMATKKTRLIIIGRDQVYTDMPEHRRSRDPAYQNERVRGTGGFDVTSFGEENLLNLPIDRYDDESIAVHEFCHTIDAALRSIDAGWEERRDATYRNAVDRGRWNLAYAASNPGEYWAEICQSYFDCNRINNWNHANVATREQLKEYDPEGYELVRSTFNLSRENDWRFTPVRVQPSVILPPAKFRIDPHYAKFTFARELPVVGSAKVSDAALLAANDTVRKLFAYRHDVLKAIINDGGKLVVLARGETIDELPEFRGTTRPATDGLRYLDYTAKVMVVPEENLLGLSSDPLDGANSVVRALSRAAYRLTANRPTIEDWDRRPARSWQQYELHVDRLDTRFGERVKALQEHAKTAGLWRGTPAASDPMIYFSAGVEAYFDAAGRGVPPATAARPVTTRDALREYDRALFDLIDQTFTYAGHADWRSPACRRDD